MILHRIGVNCGTSGRLRLIAPTYNPIPPDPHPDCKQATLQTSSKNDSRVWGRVGYSRSVATGSSARVATGKRRGGAGADRIGQDLHLRAALSEPESSGGVHRPDPRTC